MADEESQPSVPRKEEVKKLSTENIHLLNMDDEESQPSVPREEEVKKLSTDNVQNLNMADEESQLAVPREVKVKEILQKNQKGASSAALPIMAIPMVVIGHIYLFDCKVQPCIPIYLLVGGYSNILGSLMQFGVEFWWREDSKACKIIKYWSYQMWIFITIWNIVGSVWVYGVKNVDYEDITSVEYCNKTLYYFSWWYLTVSWSLLGFLIGIVILCGCCAAILSLCGVIVLNLV